MLPTVLPLLETVPLSLGLRAPELFGIVLFPFWVAGTRQMSSQGFSIAYQLWDLRQVISFYASVSPSVHKNTKVLPHRVVEGLVRYARSATNCAWHAA